jgi:hypothetical protein
MVERIGGGPGVLHPHARHGQKPLHLLLGDLQHLEQEGLSLARGLLALPSCLELGVEQIALPVERGTLLA